MTCPTCNETRALKLIWRDGIMLKPVGDWWVCRKGHSFKIENKTMEINR